MVNTCHFINVSPHKLIAIKRHCDHPKMMMNHDMGELYFVIVSAGSNVITEQ